MRNAMSREMWDVWSGQNYTGESENVGEVSRRPGEPNMLLGGWERGADNLELTGSDAAGEQGAENSKSYN